MHTKRNPPLYKKTVFCTPPQVPKTPPQNVPKIPTFAPPPPCLGTALRKNRPLVPRLNSRTIFFPHGIRFFMVLVDPGQLFRCAGQQFMCVATGPPIRGDPIKPPPPNNVPPPNSVPPQIVYPPWSNKRFAKYCTPFSSHASKRNTNRFRIRSQHHYTVAHLKKVVIVVCLFTLETLLEVWDTAAEGAAPAPSALVTHTSAKNGEGDSETPKWCTLPNSVPPGPIECQANTVPRGILFGGWFSRSQAHIPFKPLPPPHALDPFPEATSP